MTWFFTKKKKIVLECITYRAEVAAVAPIARAGNFLPQWWKDLPKSDSEHNNFTDNPTMRSCAGMVHSYAHGVVLPLWSDVVINIGAKGTGEYRYQFSDATSTADNHNQIQRGEFMPDADFLHLKLIAPWQIYCEEDVNFVFTEPTWNTPPEGQYKVLPGIVNYKYQNIANINIMFERAGAPRKVQLSLGQPLAHIIPIDERPIEIKMIVDEDRYKSMYNMGARRLSFFDDYKKKRFALKSNEIRCLRGQA